MDKNKQVVSEEDLKKAFEGSSSVEKSPKKDKKAKIDKTEKKVAKKDKSSADKKLLVLLIIGIVGLIAGVVMVVVAILLPRAEEGALQFPVLPSKTKEDISYSPLTGEPLADANLATAPTFCIQTPNGTDGARPQSGLNEAGVVFEAIAEMGITRFAAIYQNPSSAVIGPIRSLRMYYLEWDTPFDCTIVHAGGADDAIAALRSGGYRELDESYSYMYRGTYGVRRWNNLFTTSNYLKKYNDDKGWGSSDVKGFTRMTPKESEENRALALAGEKLNITTPAEENTSSIKVQVPEVTMKFGGVPTFNVHYVYDAESNTYLRSYENGVSHDVYNCSAEDLGERNPEDVCELAQLAPSVVVAIKVAERKASDNYHESIDAIGSGEAFIFQNGSVFKGTWRKDSRQDQIRFTDEAGDEIKLAPGQTFVSAVPNYGSVEY